MQFAAAIMDGQGKPVELEFRDVGEGLAGNQAAHAPVEIAQFLFAEDVVEAQHGARMVRLDAALARLAAHALGG
jgi:hypothetical protein